MRKVYPSDISDREWEIIKPLLPSSKLRGRKRDTDLREVVNAIFYLLKEGCQWRALPHDFPHWSRSGERRRCWKQRRIAIGNRSEPTLTNGTRKKFGIR